MDEDTSVLAQAGRTIKWQEDLLLRAGQEMRAYVARAEASEAARAALVEERDQWKAWAETVEGLIEHRCFVHDTIQPECESCETIVAIGESSESLQQARALLARADGGGAVPAD